MRLPKQKHINNICSAQVCTEEKSTTFELISAGNYMFKLTIETLEQGVKWLTIKLPERRHWRHFFAIFIFLKVNSID